MLTQQKKPLIILISVLIFGCIGLWYLFSIKTHITGRNVAEIAQTAYPFIPEGFSIIKHAEQIQSDQQVVYSTELRKGEKIISILISDTVPALCPGQEIQRGTNKLCYYTRSGTKNIEFIKDQIKYHVSSKDVGFTELERISESL